MERWPNFFIVGAAKAGTTSLYYYLKQHPEIFMSSIKEPKFFLPSEMKKKISNKCILKEEEYLECFKKVRNEKIVGEATSAYLNVPMTPQLIHQKIPDANILISLRDPVEDIFSRYLMHKRKGRIRYSFAKVIEKNLNKQSDIILSLNSVLYYENVKRYLDIFGKKQVKVIIFEEFIKNVNGIMKEILEFLAVKNKDFEFEPETRNLFKEERSVLTYMIEKQFAKKNIAIQKVVPEKILKFVSSSFLYKDSEKPKINHKEKMELVKFYASDVNELEELFGRKLPWKNFHD